MGIFQSVFLFLRAFIMGRAFPPLGKLALCPGYRAARNGHPMAPEWFPIVWETEIQARQTWAPAHRTEDT
jgi:hypothetical protein